MQIRLATPEDAEAIAEAHMHSINTLGPRAYAPDVVADWGKPRDGTRYRDAMKKESFFLAIDEDNKKCFGFSSLRQEDGMWRIAVYVRGDAVRQGLGKTLFEKAESLARTNNAPFIILDSSLIAVPFYKACGFYELEKTFHRLPSGQNMECIKMRKDLN